MSKELKNALKLLAQMHAPSVEEILRKRGFPYEADIVKQVVMAFEKKEK